MIRAGSIPVDIVYSSVAQWIAREAHNLKVIGSIPFTAEDRVSSVGRAPDF